MVSTSTTAWDCPTNGALDLAAELALGLVRGLLVGRGRGEALTLEGPDRLAAQLHSMGQPGRSFAGVVDLAQVTFLDRSVLGIVVAPARRHAACDRRERGGTSAKAIAVTGIDFLCVPAPSKPDDHRPHA